ncbi:MAG: alpha-amylase, partial [Bacteroidaceae bacterium]|nr:alpha-amylase [Bacteroidaceae bacterium]
NLINRTHRSGLKMIIDFVPNHVARQYHSDAKPNDVDDLGEKDNSSYAFSPNNNFYYVPKSRFAPTFGIKDSENKEYVEIPAKATGNDCFTQWPNRNDWYETVKLNYGVDYMGGKTTHFYPIPDTWKKMLHILLFWASKGIDGFRCDMAEMVPCEFWGWAIPQVKEQYKNIIFIAEVYNPKEYRNYIYNGKFDYLYDKVGLYDTLRSVINGNSATNITSCWQSVDDINTNMLNFLENHDEQRIASKFFAGSAERAKPALVISALMRTNPMMIYFGQELGEQGMYTEGFSGEDGRTTIFDYWTIDSIRRWRNNGKFDGSLLSKEEKELQNYYMTILNLCNKEKAIREGDFFDIMYANYNNNMMNEHRQYAFLRKSGHDLILVVANFEDKPARSWIKIPTHAFDCLGIKKEEKSYIAKDLITGKKIEKILIPDGTIYIEIPANDAKILKFKV